MIKRHWRDKAHYSNFAQWTAFVIKEHTQSQGATPTIRMLTSSDGPIFDWRVGTNQANALLHDGSLLHPWGGKGQRVPTKKMPIEHLVVDTNALLHYSADKPFPGRHVWTLPELKSQEIRDKDSRDRLASVFAAGIVKTRSPCEKAMKVVRDFCRRTGDAATLSWIDTRLVALTWTLYAEHMKGDTSALRIEPLPMITQHGVRKDSLPAVVEGKGAGTSSTDATSSVDELKEERDPDFDDGEGEWLTPSNYRKHRSPSGACHRQEAAKKDEAGTLIAAACMTSDYAMQNALLQMGLHVIAGQSGLHISKLKSWVLRCHACFAIEWDLGRRFCDKCGLPSLIRTSYSVDQGSGQLTLYLKRNFIYNLRGSQYSIPKPKGGKQVSSGRASRSNAFKRQDIILREDQKEFQRGMKAFERTRDISDLDPDALPALLSSMTLPESRRLHPPTIGYGRRNVNQVR